MRIQKGDISVIIPVYNSEKTIEKTLDSICGQGRRELIGEIIAVNDGSADKSADAIRRYAQRSPIKIELINKKNGGVSSARNRGMERASGSWFAFCDADDAWLADKLAIQRRIIERTDADFLGGNHTDGVMRILWRPLDKLHRFTVRELCIKTLPQTSTVLMSRRIYDELGGFDERQRYAEDGNYFLKIAANYNYYYSPIKVVDYGGGKRGFGVSGLTANMRGMYRGNVKNLKEMLELNYISAGFYILMRIFCWLKYCRRIMIKKLYG